jgi:hypothetical protein
VNVYGYIPETFVPFSFSKDNFGFWIQNTFLKNTRIRLTLNYMRYFHNEHYTEYDCKNWLYAVDFFQPVHKKLKLQGGYHFGTSDAKGYDEPGETKETSDDSDATYEEEGFSLGFSWQLPGVKKYDHFLNAEFEFAKKYYTTKNFLEEDEEHAGRVDDNLQLSVTYEIKLRKSLKLSAFYNFYFRDTDTEATVNKEYLSAEKDYRQNQYGLRITYNLRLSHTSGGEL